MYEDRCRIDLQSSGSDSSNQDQDRYAVDDESPFLIIRRILAQSCTRLTLCPIRLIPNTKPTTPGPDVHATSPTFLPVFLVHFDQALSFFPFAPAANTRFAIQASPPIARGTAVPPNNLGSEFVK